MIISKYLRYVTAETRKEFQWLQFENTVNVKAKEVSSCIAKKRSNAFGKLSCIFLSYEFGKSIGFISSLSMNMVVLGWGKSHFNLEAEAQCSYYSPCVFWMNSIPSQWCLAIGDGWWIFSEWIELFCDLLHLLQDVLIFWVCSLRWQQNVSCTRNTLTLRQEGKHKLHIAPLFHRPYGQRECPKWFPFLPLETHLALKGHLVYAFRTGRVFSIWFNFQHSQSEKPTQSWFHHKWARK